MVLIWGENEGSFKWLVLKVQWVTVHICNWAFVTWVKLLEPQIKF